MPSVVQARGLTGEDLTHLGFPPVQYNQEYATSGPSLGSGVGHDYTRGDGTLEAWEGFENEVRWNVQNHPPDRAAILAFEPLDLNAASSCFTSLEHYMCGEEKGIEGRFVHHVLQVMTAVAKRSNVPIMFGDYRATYRSGEGDRNNKPDFVAMTQEQPNVPGAPPGHEIRFIGEAKADFRALILLHFQTTDGTFSNNRRKWVGQSFRYMREFRVRYSFITTQLYTVFLKLEIDPTTGYSQLLYSRPIPAQSVGTDSSVSVRECMWFLMQKTRSDWSSDPGRNASQAVAGASSGSFPAPNPHLHSYGGESITGARRSQRDHGGGPSGSGSNTYQVPHHHNMRYRTDQQRVMAPYDQRPYYPAYDRFDYDESKSHYQGYGGNQPPSYDLSEKLGSMTLYNAPQTKALRHVYVYEHLGKWFWEVQRGKSHKFKLKDKGFKIDRNTQQATLKIQGETFLVIVADEDRPAMFGT